MLLKALLGSDILDGIENGVDSIALFLVGIFSAMLKAEDAVDNSSTPVNNPFSLHSISFGDLFFLLLVGVIASTTANNAQSQYKISYIDSFHFNWNLFYVRGICTIIYKVPSLSFSFPFFLDLVPCFLVKLL